MAYDEALVRRVRGLLEGLPGYSERRMFGGICFMLSGRMCCGVVGRELVVRVGAQGYDAALRRPHARPMDFTGRPLKGFVYVAPDGCQTAPALERWVGGAVEFASGLEAAPKKKKRAPARGRRRAS